MYVNVNKETRRADAATRLAIFRMPQRERRATSAAGDRQRDAVALEIFGIYEDRRIIRGS